MISTRPILPKAPKEILRALADASSSAKAVTRPGPAKPAGARASASSDPQRTEKLARPARTLLGSEQSAALREQLLADLDRVQSADAAADWAHKNLSAKNTLLDGDADAVEARFRERLATIEAASTSEEEAQSGPREGSVSPLREPFLATTDDAYAHRII